MRTTIELPDELLARAKSRAALNRLSLKEFFIEALEEKLAPPAVNKIRRPPRVISTGGAPIADLTSQQIEKAFFDIDTESVPGRR